MIQTPDYITVNNTLWDAKTPHHVQSDFYRNADFLAGKNTLNPIELNLLGDVAGKKILHLQCHFGQDTLSLARMGAEVTGVDFSGAAIAQARAHNNLLGLNARFIQRNIFEVHEVLHEQFDIVFSSYGTICWLPDMQQWAAVVSRYVRPGGQFIFAEFHPAIWMFDNDFTHLQYSYFNRERIEETETGTYADTSAHINLKSITWNHDLSEVMQSLLHSGLQLQHFAEYDHSPYGCFKNVVKNEAGTYQISGIEGKLPMVYSLKMTK